MQSTPDNPDFIDHDGMFKELIRNFTYEFLELFSPELTKDIAPDSLEFLDKELFQLLDQGERKEVDLLIKAQFRTEIIYFLIHIEVQSTSRNWSPKRMFHYMARLYERFDMPVYPIALLTWDKPQKEAENQLHFTFPDMDVLQFRFRTVQLNRLNWRDFMRLENPVATALMAKMKIPVEDRPRVKLEYLRMIATLRIDSAKSALIWKFMETYLNLNKNEEQTANSMIEAEFPTEIQEKIMDFTTSFHQQGKIEGKIEGIELAKRETVKHFVSKRFGEPVLGQHESALDALPLSEIEAFFDAAIFFSDASQIEAWFGSHRAS